MNEKRLWICLIGLHAIFMIKQVFFENSLLQDSREYLYAADNLIRHGQLYAWNLNHAWNPDWLSKRPFLYPLILAGIKLLSFGSQTLFLLLLYGLQNILSLLSLRMGIMLFKLYGRPLNPIWALLFMLFSISQFIYANMVMSEIWLQGCITAFVWLLLCKPDTRYKWLYAALLLTAGIAIKPVLIFAAYLLPVLYLVLERKQFKTLAFLFCFIPLLQVLLVSSVNLKRSKYFHYSSIGNINLLHYNTYTVLLYSEGSRYADSCIDDIKTRAMLLNNYPAGQKLIRQECTSIIRKRAGTYLFLHLRGVLFCLLDPGRFDISQFFGLPHGKNLLYESSKPGIKDKIRTLLSGPAGILLLALGLFNGLRLLLMVRFICLRGLKPALRWGLLLMPAYIVFLTGPIGASRFFMPLVPIALAVCLIACAASIKKN